MRLLADVDNDRFEVSRRVAVLIRLLTLAKNVFEEGVKPPPLLIHQQIYQQREQCMCVSLKLQRVR